jgi:hypothetical protein
MDSVGGEGGGTDGSGGSAGTSGGSGGSGGTTSDAGAGGEGEGDGGAPPRGCEACNDDCSTSDIYGDVVSACFEAPGVAIDGPAAGTEIAVLCAELMTCMLETRCYDVDGSFDAVNCYCGTGNCQLGGQPGGANGACVEQVEAGAESTEYAVVTSNFYDQAYAVGRGVLLLECYDADCSERDVCVPLGP